MATSDNPMAVEAAPGPMGTETAPGPMGEADPMGEAHRNRIGQNTEASGPTASYDNIGLERFADPLRPAISPQPVIGSRKSLDKINKKICGKIVDFTGNHGTDNRIWSPLLCQKRAMYVYLPPCYSKQKSYPLMLWLHGAFGDEHAFLDSPHLKRLDSMIRKGECPPVVVACPDGTYDGTNRLRSVHSFYINGVGGPFEDFLMQEIVPFLEHRYCIQSDRKAHVVFGLSAGAFGALNLAMKHRDYFSAVAVLAPPANVRYGNTKGNYFANFNPRTFRWNDNLDYNIVIGKFFHFIRIRAWQMAEKTFGPEETVQGVLHDTNPADLLFTTNLQPGELDIFINYPGKDNFNFDAQSESFAWLARQRGIQVCLQKAPCQHHLVPYFRRNIKYAYCYLSKRLPRPIPCERPACETCPPAAGIFGMEQPDLLADPEVILVP